MRKCAEPTYGCGAEPYRQLVGDEATDYLPEDASALTATDFNTAKLQAHGVGADDGYTTISTSGAAALTLYIYDRAQNAWVLAGATAARQTVTYTAAAMHDWLIPPGALFYVVSGTAERRGYTSAPTVNEYYPPRV